MHSKPYYGKSCRDSVNVQFLNVFPKSALLGRVHTYIHVYTGLKFNPYSNYCTVDYREYRICIKLQWYVVHVGHFHIPIPLSLLILAACQKTGHCVTMNGMSL